MCRLSRRREVLSLRKGGESARVRVDECAGRADRPAVGAAGEGHGGRVCARIRLRAEHVLVRWAAAGRAAHSALRLITCLFCSVLQFGPVPTSFNHASTVH